MKKQFTNGVQNISNEDYHSSEGFSRSQIMTFKQSPYHFWYKHLSGLYEHEKETPALILGNLVHTLVLEPEKYHINYDVIPACDKRTKEGKALYSSFMATIGQRTPITKEQYDTAHEMAKAVKSNNVIAQLIEGTIIEQSIYFTHELSGLQCKVRPDAWLGTMAFDLKTTDNAGYKAFQSSALKYGYFLQAAMVYRAFESIDVELEEFIFFPVEKAKPYATSVDRCLKQDLDYGFELFDDLMIGIAKCIESNNWPSYGIRELKVPAYASYDTLLEIE